MPSLGRTDRQSSGEVERSDVVSIRSPTRGVGRQHHITVHNDLLVARRYLIAHDEVPELAFRGLFLAPKHQVPFVGRKAWKSVIAAAIR